MSQVKEIYCPNGCRVGNSFQSGYNRKGKRDGKQVQLKRKGRRLFCPSCGYKVRR
jgi:hypothetical protein